MRYGLDTHLSLKHTFTHTDISRHACKDSHFPFNVFLHHLLTHKHIHAHTHTLYHAERQDSCPPSVNVIHEEMEMWPMSDEFPSGSGLAKTSRKTNHPIYREK